MPYISLPKKFTIEEEVKGKKAKVVIEPCFPGYGMTLGNALRRVLLSSMAGGAVTAIKVKGVSHEFSTLENVSEDITEIILNLKQLRVRVHTNESVVLHLKVKGEKDVTGADIEHSSDAEVINKNMHIASLNSKDAELDMEITVAKGIGYVPTEEQDKSKGKGEIGTILVDSIFTPVVNVGMDIEATRVGQKVDYDKLILNIETDGSVTPEEAVQKAAEILASQFSWVMEGGTKEVDEVDSEAPVILPAKEEMPVEEIVSEEIAEDEEAEDDGEEGDDKPKKRGRPKKEEK